MHIVMFVYAYMHYLCSTYFDSGKFDKLGVGKINNLIVSALHANSYCKKTLNGDKLPQFFAIFFHQYVELYNICNYIHIHIRGQKIISNGSFNKFGIPPPSCRVEQVIKIPQTSPSPSEVFNHPRPFQSFCNM